MNKFINNDSLVFSELASQQEENLLYDSSLTLNQKNIALQSNNVSTITIEKGFKEPQFFSNRQSFVRLLQRDNQDEHPKEPINKTFKKLSKEKQKNLNFESRMQNISLRNGTKAEKINELVSIIQCERIAKQQRKLKQFAKSLIQLAEDLINQKKALQKQLENMIEFNKLITSKFRQVERNLQQVKNRPHLCSCKKPFSFSKNRESPINYWERFQLAKTVINSIEQFELKKVEEQQGANMTEMPLVQLLWVLKNKAQGQSVNLSQGLLDRVSTGPTLKSWISIISQKLSHSPKVSDFSIQNIDSCSNQDSSMRQFLSIIEQNIPKLVENVCSSKDAAHQMEMIQFSSFATFTQILRQQIETISKQEAMANFGQLNRCLKIIQKKAGISKQCRQIFNPKSINQWIQSCY